jgi:hypothetical protein
MLRGFKGFHGELTRLWDDTATKSQKDNMKHMVDDKMENDRRGKLRAERENKASRKVEPKPLGGVAKRDVLLRTEVVIPRNSSVEGLEQRMNGMQSVLNDVRRKVGLTQKDAEESLRGSIVDDISGDTAGKESNSVEAVGKRLEGMEAVLAGIKNGIAFTESVVESWKLGAVDAISLQTGDKELEAAAERSKGVDTALKLAAVDGLSGRESGDTQPAELQVADDTISITAEPDASVVDLRRKIDT